MPDRPPDQPLDAPLDPLEDTNLHGPFAGVVGYRLSDWSADRAVVTLAVGGRHMNRSGVLHGGVLTTLIDTACGLSGCYREPHLARRRAMTLSLNAQFLAPAQAGARLTVEARRIGGGRRIFFASCEVHDQDRRLVARGDGTFRYRRET